MPYSRPFVIDTYDSAGKFLFESDYLTAFEADANAQRLSGEGGGRVTLVKDRRHTVTKLIRVWVNGRTVFCTVNKLAAGATQVALA